MNKNNLIILSLILLTAISGFFYFFRLDSGKTTYKNETYGFSLKYPSEWSVNEKNSETEIVMFLPDSSDPTNLNHGISAHINPPLPGVQTVEELKKFIDADPRRNQVRSPAYNSKIENINGSDVVLVGGVPDLSGTGPGYQMYVLLEDKSIIQFSGNEIPEHDAIFRSLRK